MGRKITAHETCDRCERVIREIEVSADDLEAKESEAREFAYSLNFIPADMVEGHPAQETGGFGVLCDKCKVRIADLIALAFNQKPPKRRKSDESESEAA
jgi:hypothetical protein